MSLKPLFKHQQDTIDFSRGKPAVFDGSDPGTGKTRSHIEVIRARIRTDHGKVLVLCPKSLIRSAWGNDLREFAPELVASYAYAENREAAFNTAADVYITNHDAAKWLAQQKPRFFKGFSTLLIDESGAYKHYTSQRSRAVARIAPAFAHKTNMNGTINPNTILDCWHQYKILDGGQRLGKSYFHFRNAVCEPEQVGPQPNMVKWRDREGAEQVVAGLVRDITIRHDRKDCLDLPPNHEYVVKFTLKPAHMKKYLQMQHAQLAQLDSGTVTAINAASVTTKLLQISSGAVYEDEWRYHIVDEDRNELIMDLLEERQHSLVFFLWKHQKDQLEAAAKRRGYTYCVIDGDTPMSVREENVRLFQLGFYKVLLAHPQTTAHGLTLTRAKTTIWASPTYNLDHFIQGNYRIDRIGQTEKTETIIILGEDTIDEKVYYEALGPKKLHMTNLLLELKEAA